jgi:hypothetical protein
MFQKTVSWLIQKEKYFFIFVLVINLSFIFNAKFYPAMDGPAHLHNSYIFKQLVCGSDFLEQYYIINTIPIPNWTNHIVLSSLLAIVSPNNAEKGTHIIYILLLAFSFRYFIKQLQPKNIAASSLIFPFLFSFLLHLGFLNFCYSIGFMFFGLGYYLKHRNNINLKNGFILSIIITLTYFSNVLGFVYLVFFLFAFSFVNHFCDITKFNKTIIIEFIKKYVGLFLICIIPLICLALFYHAVSFFPSTNEYKNQELQDWIFNIRPLIVYVFNDDKEYTQVLFNLLMMSFSVAVFSFYKKEQRIKLSVSLVFLVTIFFTYILLLKIPDGSSAGMMSDRLGLMLFFIFLAALVSFPIPKTVLLLIVCGAVFINFSIYHYNHKLIIKNYSEHADKIFNVSSHINEKSIVLPITMDADWLEGHFSNYLGVNKEMVILENYEANVGWFPLKWNKEKLPKFVIGNKQNIGNIYWVTNSDSKIEKKIDYIFLYGNTAKLEQPEYAELKAELVSNYILDESITDSYTKLFKLK